MRLIIRRTHLVLAGLVLAAVAASPAHANVFVLYGFSSPTPLAPTTVGAGISSASSITFGGYAGQWTEPSGVLQANPGTPTTAALAVASGNYATFTLTSASPMNLTSLTLDGGYAQFSNPAGYALESSVDGYASILSTAAFTTQDPAYTTQTVDLSGASFQGLSTISFRLFGYVKNSGVEQFDNITVNGALAVPEPSALALAGIGMAGLVRLMASRRRN
jgi:hypothetical protein